MKAWAQPSEWQPEVYLNLWMCFQAVWPTAHLHLFFSHWTMKIKLTFYLGSQNYNWPCLELSAVSQTHCHRRLWGKCFWDSFCHCSSRRDLWEKLAKWWCYRYVKFEDLVCRWETTKKPDTVFGWCTRGATFSEVKAPCLSSIINLYNIYNHYYPFPRVETGKPSERLHLCFDFGNKSFFFLNPFSELNISRFR